MKNPRASFRFGLVAAGSLLSLATVLLISASIYKYVLAIESNATTKKEALQSIDHVGYISEASSCKLAKNWRKRSHKHIISATRPVWGSYRPDVYFGLKKRTFPDAIVTGLLWNSDRRRQIRHRTAENELSKLEWKRHDGRYFGEEVLHDKENNMAIDASFYVNPDSSRSSPTNLSWIQRISVSPLIESDVVERSLSFYFGVDCSFKNDLNTCYSSSQLHFKYVSEQTNSDSRTLSFGGSSLHSGNFILQVILTKKTDNDCLLSESCSADDHLSLSYYSNQVFDKWNEIDVINDEQNQLQYASFQKHPQSFRTCDKNGDYHNTLAPSSNFLSFKVRTSSSYMLECKFYEDVQFKSKKEFEVVSKKLFEYEEDVDPLVESQRAFDKRFESTFQLDSKGLDSDDRRLYNSNDIATAKIALSSLLGGIGFFHGSPEIGNSTDEPDANLFSHSKNVDLTTFSEPVALLTCTPSRTVFPRGFLWDEGFHQLLVSKWDYRLSFEIISHWLSSMNFNEFTSPYCSGGWIPREMILGDIGRNRVPQEFIVQRIDIANPPTLLLAIESILENYYVLLRKSENEEEILYIQDKLSLIFPALDDWVTWFIQSQSNYGTKSFRWRGRSISDNKRIPNTLASGLDDYPRSFAPSSEESHVDLHAWIAKACVIMDKIERIVNSSSDKYSIMSKNILHSLYETHWSSGDEKLGVLPGFYDIGLDSNKNRFENITVIRCGNDATRTVLDVQVPIAAIQKNIPFCPVSHPKPLFYFQDENGNMKVIETLDLAPISEMKIQLIRRVGYVNIIPLILQLVSIEDVDKLSALLDIVESPDLLWTEFGLRSIAKTDMFYKKRNAEGDAPYWRGPIWININFLALRALNYYQSIEGPLQYRFKNIYKRLHGNVVNTVLNSMASTGFLWEQYNDLTGEGMRGRPFTGWTALIANIMAEMY